MYLLLPKPMQAKIQQELDALPAIHGKIVLQIEINCSMERKVGSLKILRSTQEEFRP